MKKITIQEVSSFIDSMTENKQKEYVPSNSLNERVYNKKITARSALKAGLSIWANRNILNKSVKDIFDLNFLKENDFDIFLDLTKKFFLELNPNIILPGNKKASINTEQQLAVAFLIASLSIFNAYNFLVS